MKKLLIFSGLIMVSTLSLQAQNAVNILNAVNKKYTSMNSYSANFTVKGSQNGSGTLLSKGIKYKLSFDGQDIYNNGKDVYAYLADINEVNVTSYNPGDESYLSPNNIFKLYQKGYNASYISEKTIGGKKYDIVSLTPKTRSSISKIELTIGKTDLLISSWTIHEKGAATTFTIVNFNANVTFSDAVFTFDRKKHPGVEVVDLR